jgi:hypothetical protein
MVVGAAAASERQIRYMARVERLFQRLDELEREYRTLLVNACRDELAHKFSKTAVRALLPGLLDGKFWRDQEAAHFEYLDKEIRGLRNKLSLPLSESPVSELEQLRDVFRGKSDGEGRRLLQNFIDRQTQAVRRAI